MYRGKTALMCVFYGGSEPLLELFVCRLGADDEVLGVVEEDAYTRKGQLRAGCNGELRAPVGLPNESRTMTPPSTSVGRGSIERSTAWDTQSMWPSLLWSTTGRPATIGSASRAFYRCTC